jgi:hypothetical protein
VKGVSFTGFPGWAMEHPHLSLALVTPAGLLLALLLAWRPVASRLQEFVDPFAYAERHARHAVHITLAADQEPPSLPAEAPDTSAAKPLAEARSGSR